MTEIENETIKALRRQLENAERDQKFWSEARNIAMRGGTVEDIQALGENIPLEVARSCLNRDSIMYHTESQNVSAKKVNFLKKKLAMAIQQEKERMRKRGLL